MSPCEVCGTAEILLAVLGSAGTLLILHLLVLQVGDLPNSVRIFLGKHPGDASNSEPALSLTLEQLLQRDASWSFFCFRGSLLQ